MSRYTLVRAKNASKTVGLYVDGQLVCTHDRTSRKQDVDLSIHQRFGDANYTEKVADRPGSLPNHLDEGYVDGGVKNDSSKQEEAEAKALAEAEAQEAARLEAESAKAEEESDKAAPQPEPKARPQKQGKK